MNNNYEQQFIWVAPGEGVSGEGTYNHPFLSVSKAVECAIPGQSVVLKAGIYTGDVTIHKSGLIDKPLRIMAEKDAKVFCKESTWFLYDVCDIILSRIGFQNSPGMALSVVGKCERNRFEFLDFIDCGISQKDSCTFFLGGSGQVCTIVESCTFERSSNENSTDLSVGLLLSEGDYQQGDPNCNCVVTKNRFVNYGLGIVVGSQDSNLGEYSHVVSYNIVDHCSADAIVVKCGDTSVKGNTIQNCLRNSISVVAGKSSTIEENRIVDCGNGIRVAGIGHTIANNVIVRSKNEAISVLSAISEETTPASNILIEHNSCIDWGQTTEDIKNQGAVVVGLETSCIVRRNLFHGFGKPVHIEKARGKAAAVQPRDQNSFITDNICCGECKKMPGVTLREVDFAEIGKDNYNNSTGYGAQGWILKPGMYIPEDPSEDDRSLDEQVPESEDEENAPLDEVPDDADDGDYEEGEEIFRSFFMHDEEHEKTSRQENEDALFNEREE